MQFRELYFELLNFSTNSEIFLSKSKKTYKLKTFWCKISSGYIEFSFDTKLQEFFRQGPKKFLLESRKIFCLKAEKII